MNKSLATSFIIIAYLIGVGVGFFLTPEYTQMEEAKTSPMMELGKADRNLDLRFINGMIAHHQSAIYLSEQAIKNSSRTEIRELAHTIINLDQEGIKRLYSWKEQWYRSSEKITNFQKINLGPADSQFDLRFLNAMITHHEEAIAVATDVLTKSYRTEVLNEANAVNSLLSENLRVLKEWREAWYGVK